MALSLVSAPATEPLTIREVKGHLRLDDTNGEPAPTAITAALAAAGAGNVDNGAHRYLATFVTLDGETCAGIISAAVTVVDKTTNGKVSLSAIPVGGSAVTFVNLYRTVAAGSTYLYLGQVANGVTVFTDNVADASLGVQAPTVNTTADPELVSWITAAREFAETYTHRAFITQTWDYACDSFPPNWSSSSDWRGVDLGAIWLPKAPLQSVTSLSYVDATGATQVWATSNYTVDAPTGPTARMGRIVPGYNIPYPVPRLIANAVTVRFVAGYGASSAVPRSIKSAMKLLIGNWWQNREAGAIIRASSDVLPFGVAELLWPFKSF